jgi:IS30 family transposase
MPRIIRPYLGSAERAQIWGRWRAGEPIWRIARALDRTSRTVCDELDRGGGISPRPRRRAPRSLSLREREEISRGLATQRSLRSIARSLCRSTSSISREVRRNGGAHAYRANSADRRAWDRARRPKACLLARAPRLRQCVAEKLQLQWSPQQIAAWLVRYYPSDQSMRVSHETIYRTLFVQARGALKRELTAHLRSHRKRRGARHSEGAGARGGSIVGELSIRERPAEAEDRAVPGHWEGDLLCGSNGSQIATLVERNSRLVMLQKLPDKNSVRVARALARKIKQLPKELRRSLAWDRGIEMASHRQFTLATDVQVYFCDPYSPWQRGSNENTNGLLRQYFPKGRDLSVYSQAQLDEIADRLNGRPRQTLGWQTPAERFAQTVASTS